MTEPGAVPALATAPAAALPAAFRERMARLLGPEAEALFRALARPPAVGLRLNGLRGAPADLVKRLPWALTPVPWCPAGYVVEMGAAPAGAVAPGRHPYQEAGVYYLQDPAAMAVAEALAPRPGELVLDLAAAPGGKSTQLSAMLAGTGWLVANDVHPQRARALVGNLERCGVANATVLNETPARLAQAWPGRFDRVLLDAPCSGEGMFRKSGEARAMWSEGNVLACARRQDELLAEAARLVRPGGHLAYSTCTFAPEENERVVAHFLAAHREFELAPLALPGTAPGRPEWLDAGTAGAADGATDGAADGAADGRSTAALAGAARIWPHLAPGEGHFVALLRRVGDASTGAADAADAGGPGGAGERRGRPARAKGRGGTSEVGGAARVAWREFAVHALTGAWPERLAPTGVQGEWAYQAAHAAAPLDLAGLRWLRHGLQLGQLRTGHRSTRLEPAHALAMALPGAAVGERLSFAPEDERVRAFLAGAEVEAAGAQGYVRLEVDGFPLGWGKRSGGRVRSLLPKGVRRPL